MRQGLPPAPTGRVRFPDRQGQGDDPGPLAAAAEWRPHRRPASERRYRSPLLIAGLAPALSRGTPLALPVVSPRPGLVEGLPPPCLQSAPLEELASPIREGWEGSG